MSAKERIIAGVMTGAMAFTMASCQIEGQEPTIVNTTSISTETTTNPDLKDVAPERLEFTKDLLNLYDVSSSLHTSGDYEGAFDKIKDFISRDQILEYGKTGETGENLSIVKHKDGSPAVALINCNDKVANDFKVMIEKMNKYDSDYLKKITRNGMVAFMVNRYNNDQGNNFTFNNNGLIVWNVEDSNSKNNGYLEAPIGTECFGIKVRSLGGDYAKYSGFVKEQLSSDCWWNLYKKTGDNFCRDMSYHSYMIAKDFYGKIYSPMTLKDKEIQDLINNARKLVSLFGGTEAEISKSITDRPDWNLDDIK